MSASRITALTPWEVVIGLETHAQLSTASKIFSGASTAFGAAPNTQASAVDIALPGVLPVLNKGAVERAIRFGLAVGGTINAKSVFARKNYFYPDLPKGYQISQYEIPVVAGGGVDIVSPERGAIRVRLTRAHLEEDAGKSLHEDYHGMSGIDLNRAGTPLLEIVSEPDLRSSEEAVAYAKALHALVRWIGICDGNMQEGSFRCDANVSVRRHGEPLGTRCEIKNLNSFRFMQQAIDFEVRRQVALIEEGGKVVQETRLYDPDRDETRSMRSKEDAQDYRYFPDPDLPPLSIDAAWIERIREEMPELPEFRKLRFSATSREHLIELVKGGSGVDLSGVDDQVYEEGNLALQVSAQRPHYGLPVADAAALVASRALADFYEDAVAAGGDPRAVANWMLGEVAAALNRSEREIDASPVSPAALAGLLKRIADGTISGKLAKDVFDAMWAGEATGDGAADAIIVSKGLTQISDEGAIAKLVDEVIAANPSIVAEFRAGKEKAFNALVGKAMAASKGKANPAQVNAILRARLGSP
jgi:aspartyl-tRNA(Asn)/glutamyl-tRNA(Gln) amidotransferase subunit B